MGMFLFARNSRIEAQCELARYRGAAPSRLQYPFGLTEPVIEVVLHFHPSSFLLQSS
jgi:hypothetical protein